MVTISGPEKEVMNCCWKETHLLTHLMFHQMCLLFNHLVEVQWLVLPLYAPIVESPTNNIHHCGVIETMNVEKPQPFTVHFVPIVLNKRVTWRNMLKESTVRVQIQKQVLSIECVTQSEAFHLLPCSPIFLKVCFKFISALLMCVMWEMRKSVLNSLFKKAR